MDHDRKSVLDDKTYEKYKILHSKYHRAAMDIVIKHGGHNAIFLIVGKNTIHILPAKFQDNVQKLRYLEMCRLIAYKMNSDCVFFISEVWYAQQSIDDYTKPVDSPNRREGIFTLLWVRDKGSRLKVSRINRNNRGDVQSCTPDHKFEDHSEFGGLFTMLCGEGLNKLAKLCADNHSVNDILSAMNFSAFEIDKYKRHYKKLH